jgi:diguanylate cyclase (GGDEF)-like protein/PAS domain S-box-containing protein
VDTPGFPVATMAADRFAAAFTSSPLGMGLVDARGSWVEVNPALCGLLTKGPEDLLGRPAIQLIPPDERATVRGRFAAVPREGGVEIETHVQSLLSDPIDVIITATQCFLEDGDPGLLLHVHDVRERLAAQERLTKLALHDALTGLPNRVLLLDRLTTALARAIRTGSYPALFYLDLDGFKLINDHLGHQAGDEVLGEIGEQMLALVRPADTVARIGGDEFVILCEDLESPQEAWVISERLRKNIRVERPVTDAEDLSELVVTASIGVSCAEEDQDPEELLRAADRAMYVMKGLHKKGRLSHLPSSRRPVAPARALPDSA